MSFQAILIQVVKEKNFDVKQNGYNFKKLNFSIFVLHTNNG